jgi:chorismate dehydratase
MSMNRLKSITEKKNVRVGRIGYINVAPVYYGLEQTKTPSHIRLVSEPPAVLNRMMEQGTIDISPVSSAAYARNHHKWTLLPNHSISAFGKVMSVILASNYPLEELDNRNILLTDESASAADMLKLVLSWKGICPRFETGTVHSSRNATYKEHDALLVIGNQALTGEWNKRFRYTFDLGELWKNMTGLPFVFAVWAVRKPFAQKHPELVIEIAKRFERSKQLGMLHMAEIQETTSRLLNLDPDCCKTYFNLLNYRLGNFELQGLKTFYKGLSKENVIPGSIKLSFFSTAINEKILNFPIELQQEYRSSRKIFYLSMQKQALMSLRSLHFPLPLKKVFPQLLHLLRQGRP